MAATPRTSPLLALCAVLVAAAIACRSAPPTVPASQSYYPLAVGQRWVYDSHFHGPNARTTTSTVAVCRIREGDAVTMYLVGTCADDTVIQTQLVYRRGQEIAEPVVINRDGEPRPRDPPKVIARLDMRVGQVWTWVGEVGDDERHSLYRVANRGRVFTPAGEFEGVRLLVMEGTANASVERWYVPGIGLVKEAGAVYFPMENGQRAHIELVRSLREYGIVPVAQIACCGKLPGGAG